MVSMRALECLVTIVERSWPPPDRTYQEEERQWA
jgi:hypothetical protein